MALRTPLGHSVLLHRLSGYPNRGQRVILPVPRTRLFARDADFDTEPAAIQRWRDRLSSMPRTAPASAVRRLWYLAAYLHARLAVHPEPGLTVFLGSRRTLTKLGDKAVVDDPDQAWTGGIHQVGVLVLESNVVVHVSYEGKMQPRTAVRKVEQIARMTMPRIEHSFRHRLFGRSGA